MALASARSRLVWICWTRISWAVDDSARLSATASSRKVRQPATPKTTTGHDHQRGQPAQLPRACRSARRRGRLDRQRRRFAAAAFWAAGEAAGAVRRGGPGGWLTASPRCRAPVLGIELAGRRTGGSRLGRCSPTDRHVGGSGSSSRSSGSSSRSCSTVGSSTSRSRQACRPMARLQQVAGEPAVAERRPARRAATGSRRSGVRQSRARRSRRPRPAAGRSPAARRRCSRRTRWWSGTGWPVPGSGR